MAEQTIITPQRIREALDYDKQTGVFTWRSRPREHFKTRGAWLAWNKRFAGGEAGIVQPHGYRRICIDRTFYYAHRLAWILVTGEAPPHQIDHINSDRSDNRFANLRAANESQNGANQRLRKENTSGFKGVCWSKQKNKWKAEIKISGTRYHLGLFDNPEDAHRAYCSAAVKAFGEFARFG